MPESNSIRKLILGPKICWVQYKGCANKNLGFEFFCSSASIHQIFKILVPTPHNNPPIMWGRHKNFKDQCTQAEIWAWQKFKTKVFLLNLYMNKSIESHLWVRVLKIYEPWNQVSGQFHISKILLWHCPVGKQIIDFMVFILGGWPSSG